MTGVANLAIYLRRACELPPHVVVGKAIRLAARLADQRRRRAHDLRSPTYASDAPHRLERRIALDATMVPGDLVAALPALCNNHLAHRFDLLGSGPVAVRYGLTADGVEGHRYPAGPAVDADPNGTWLAERVSPANLPESRKLWRLIDGPYAPIDWQCDFKSGYRWDGRRHFRDLDYGQLPGVDVKVPWELARLQHLPQLATAHLIAAAGRPGFEPAADYAREVRNQILDFLATNPPRFGVNWLCPMDVAIRAANMLLAVDLLRAGGWRPDAAFKAALARAAVEHAGHVLDNLEWSPEARSNHYLSDIAGVLFCAAYLPAGAETDAWLAFAAHQLGIEIAFQFHADGGNVEGSTNYHRLSTELALFATALLAGAASDRAAAFAAPVPKSLRVRPPLSRTPPPSSDAADGAPVGLAATAIGRLADAVAAAEGWRKPDGTSPQIGDTDSGRLFVLHQAGPLDHRSLSVIGEALFGSGPATDRFDGVVAGALACGRKFAIDRKSATATEIGDTGFRDEAEALIADLPADRRRTWVFDLPGLRPEELTRHASPDFGLYVLRGPATYLALRCVTHGGTHQFGHTHDDNLTLELWHDGRDLIADPGSLYYTPTPHIRDAYRAASAHFTPRPATGPPAATATAPFAMRHHARATCLYFGPQGIAARLDGPGWRVLRVVRPENDRVVVVDGCPEAALAEDRTASGEITVSEGYGRRTTRPVRSV